MVWPDERLMMQLMVGEKKREGQSGSVVVLIEQHIIYCIQAFDSLKSHRSNRNMFSVVIFVVTMSFINPFPNLLM